VQVAAQVVYKIIEHFQLVQAQALQSLWGQVLPKCQPIHNHPTTDQTLCLVVSQPTVVAVVDHGTDMQVVQEPAAEADALDQTAQDQTPILDLTTAVIKTTADEVLWDKDFQAETACDITVKAKTATKQVVVVVLAVQDIPAKMIAIKV
jgi:hypothetical protein